MLIAYDSYPKRADVERANSVRLSQLEGRPRNYRGTDAPGRDETGRELSPERVERALKDVIAPKDLPLKVGAQVMLLKVTAFAISTRNGLSLPVCSVRTSSKASLSMGRLAGS